MTFGVQIVLTFWLSVWFLVCLVGSAAAFDREEFGILVIAVWLGLVPCPVAICLIWGI